MSNVNTVSNSQLRIIPPEVNVNQQPDANLPRQVSPTNSARVGGAKNSNASSADKLADLTRDGLKVVTGYKPSIKSLISSKLFSVSNFLRGEQASFPATDRRGNITFRELERLAGDVIKTEPYKSGSKEAKGQYHQSLLNFQAALTSYVQSKPVNSGFSGLLSSVDSELRSIHEAHDYAVVIRPPQLQRPPVEFEGRSTNPASHYGKVIPQPQPKPSEHYGSMAQVVPKPNSNAAPTSSVPPTANSHIPEGKQEVEESQGVPSSNNNRLGDLRLAESKSTKEQVPLSGMNSNQKARFEKLSPDRAREVLNRAHGDAKYLDILLNEAEKSSFETRPEAQLVAAKRARLTDPPALGGLGIKPSELTYKKDLGEGNFGQVKEFERKSTDPTQAVRFAGKILPQGEEAALLREEAMLARLPDHPNLVKSFGIHEMGGQKVLLQELVSGGSLDKVITGQKWNDLPAEKQVLVLKHVAVQVFRGLAELQKLGLAHEDVSARNLLFDAETFDIKLADFGIAVPRGVEDTNERHPIKWSAPEILLRNRRVSIVGDSFAASRLLVGELLQHVNLFNRAATNSRGLHDIVNADVSKALAEGDLPEQLHPDTVEALDKIDPTGNMTKFFAAISNPNPNNRMSADQALQHPFLADPPTREQLADIFNGKDQPAPEPKEPAPTGLYGLM